MENTQQNIDLYIDIQFLKNERFEVRKDFELVVSLIYDKFNALTYHEKLNIFNEYKKLENDDDLGSFEAIYEIEKAARKAIIEKLIAEGVELEKPKRLGLDDSEFYYENWFDECDCYFTLTTN
jgi:hypothetical protein